MKRLSSEQRKYYLSNLQERGAIRLLVEDFIPYIIRVAYAKSWKTNVLSVLDLVNEGILGAHIALEKYCHGEKDYVRIVRSNIHQYMNRIVSKNEGMVSFGVNPDDYSSEDHEFIRKLDYEKKRVLLSNLLSSKIGEREGMIIIDYFTNKDTKALSKRYGISCERICQIARNFSRLYKNVDNLWELFSSDFDLPVNEARFYRNIPNKRNNNILINKKNN